MSGEQMNQIAHLPQEERGDGIEHLVCAGPGLGRFPISFT